MAVFVNKVLARNTFMKDCKAPPKILLGPGKCFAAQAVDDSHIKKLKAQALRTGTTSEHGIGVVVSTELWNRWNNGEDVSLQELFDAGVEMIAGNHSRLTIIILQDTYKRNPVFKYQVFDLVLLPETPETYEVIRIHGLMDNLKARTVKTGKWYDSVWTMHTQMVAVKDEVYKGKTIPKTVMAKMKRQWATGMGIPGSSLGAYLVIARCTGELWEKIWKVISGVGIAAEIKHKKWTSSNTFCAMSRSTQAIPDSVICGWLDRGALGEMTPAAFKQNCQMYTCDTRIKIKIMDHLELLYHKKNPSVNYFQDIAQEHRWDKVETDFPTIGVESFLMTYVKLMWNKPIKHDFPESLYVDIEQAFKIAQQAVVKDKVYQQPKQVLLFFCCYCLTV
jgi:hypothetical protein